MNVLEKNLRFPRYSCITTNKLDTDVYLLEYLNLIIVRNIPKSKQL